MQSVHPVHSVHFAPLLPLLTSYSESLLSQPKNRSERPPFQRTMLPAEQAPLSPTPHPTVTEPSSPISTPSPPPRSSLSPARRTPLHRRSALWLWLSLLLPAATVYHPEAGWNVNTRLDLIFALVDQGSLRIDDYHDLGPYATGDKAYYDGHFYSDKIIGLSLLGVPAYGVLKAVLSILGHSPDYSTAHWWIRTSVVGALGAGVGVLLWFILLGLGLNNRQAFLLVTLLFFGSLLFPYAMVFYPYLPGLFFCLLAWERLESWAAQGRLPRREDIPDRAAAKGLEAIRPFVIGLALGAALLMDYVFGLAVIALSIRAVWLWRGRGFARRVFPAALGGVLPLAIFAIYTLAIFGSLSVPYRYEADPLFQIGMSQGFMGVTGFQPAALYYLTIHPYRGLFFWSPVLAVAAVGAVRLLVSRRIPGADLPGQSRCGSWPRTFPPDFSRWAGGLGIVLLAAYLLFNASYYMWWGGWAMGPRLLIPAIPFLGVGLAGVWTWGRWGRVIVVIAGVISIVLTLPPSLVDPQTPMWFHKWPDLLHPAVSQNLKPEQFLQIKLFAHGEIAPTLGRLLRLPGLWALLPVVVLWALPAGVFFRVSADKNSRVDRAG